MKIKGIGFVAIPVTDVKRARSFYEEVLGLKVSDEMMGGKWIEYSVGDETLAIANVIPVVPVPLVATVFVREPGKRRSELELKAEVLDLMGQLSERGAHVYVPRKDQDYAITVGLRMLTLRHLVEERDGLYAARPEELPLLTYYANSISHLFA